MKKLILAVAIGATAMFASVDNAQAGCCKKSCCKKLCCKKTTVEICRRCFTKCKCVCGCVKCIQYVEVTYKTTDCCGKSKIWKKTYRA